MSELPRWEVVPELKLQEVLPIPVDANSDWCAMVNYLYAGRGYQTDVRSDNYLVPGLSADGIVLPGNYTEVTTKDYEGDLNDHYFIGIFSNIVMRHLVEAPGLPKINALEVPFIRLAHAVDLDDGTKLGVKPGRHVLIPLVRTQELTLERF